MTVPIYGVAFVCTAVTGYLTDKVPDKRGMIIACWLSVSVLCSVIICAVYNFAARYVLLVIMASGLWCTNALSLSYASSTFGSLPDETRAISLALVNAMGNLASIYGAYLFPSTGAPKYIMGFGVISAWCAVSVVTYAFLHVMLKRKSQN
jgi:MFS family permease